MVGLKGKKIILGVTGGIAAYKAALIVRGLVKAGAEVRVIMTPDAAAFITPLTLSTLSNNPVHQAYFDPGTGEWDNHVHLALWADLILIAPATANTLAKMAQGICDNLLLAVYLSAKSPIVVAPAMDLDMWLHPSTQKNIQNLRDFGCRIIAPESGELASGLTGQGRLAEPDHIIASLDAFFSDQQNDNQDFYGKSVLLTAGPTYEALDPVRFLGNHSTGKMGFAIALELAKRGARVELVHGPVQIPVPPHPNVIATPVTSAQEMYERCLERFPGAGLVIMAAAVADFTPVSKSEIKIKKDPSQREAGLTVQLRKTTDILAELGRRKQDHQVLVGFALETDQEEANAWDKLQRKNLDYIVLNSLRTRGAGFGHDTNEVIVMGKSGLKKHLPLQSKGEIAVALLDFVSQEAYSS